VALHEARTLERRVPGESDLRIFTAELVRGGRHRVDSTRQWLRVVREPASGRPALRALLIADPATERRTP
jgi:hypothetical protein